MKKFNVLALFGAAAFALPTVMSGGAIAQSSPSDSEYLNNLYDFLQGQDEVTYQMATTAMSAEDNIWAAQMFCQTFELGANPSDVFAVYTSAAVEEANARGGMTDEMAYAIGLYGGAVMNVGAAHYCPQYQPQVQQALQAL